MVKKLSDRVVPTAAHPDGFVLNVRRRADPNYVVLHRATCGSISNDKQAPGAFTGRSYRKICATNVAELRLAAQREGRPGHVFKIVRFLPPVITISPVTRDELFVLTER